VTVLLAPSTADTVALLTPVVSAALPVKFSDQFNVAGIVLFIVADFTALLMLP